MRHIQIRTIRCEMDIPFLASLQVVWNGVQLLLGHQTGSEERRRYKSGNFFRDFAAFCFIYAFPVLVQNLVRIVCSIPEIYVNAFVPEG